MIYLRTTLILHLFILNYFHSIQTYSINSLEFLFSSIAWVNQFELLVFNNCCANVRHAYIWVVITEIVVGSWVAELSLLHKSFLHILRFVQHLLYFLVWSLLAKLAIISHQNSRNHYVAIWLVFGVRNCCRYWQGTLITGLEISHDLPVVARCEKTDCTTNHASHAAPKNFQENLFFVWR